MPDTTRSLYTLRDVQRLLVRWRRLMVTVFIAVFVPAALVTLLMPPEYQSTSRLLLNRESRAPDFSVRATQADGAVLRQVNQKEELTTESERIRSRAILAPVVARLELTPEKLNHVRDARRYVRWVYDWTVETARTAYAEMRYALGVSTRPSAEEIATFKSYALLEDVAGRLRVEVVPDSNIIEVSFRSSDAVLARDVCNAIVTEFLRQRSQQSPTDAHQFFLEQSKKMANELRFHEAQVDELERKFSAYSFDDQRKHLLNNFAQAEVDLKVTRTNIARFAEKARMIPPQLAAEPETITTSTDLNRNPAFDAVNQRVVELELARVKALEQYQPASQVMLAIEEQLKAARRIQAELPKTLDGSSTKAVNPIHQSLRNELLTVKTELAAHQAAERTLMDSLAAYRADMARLSENDLKIRDARRLVAAQEQAYLIYLKNQEQARVTGAMESSDLRDLRVLDEAPLPLYAVRPRTRVYLLAALAVALLAAFGLALLAEQNDRTLGDPSDVRRALDLPVLASYPRLPADVPDL